MLQQRGVKVLRVVTERMELNPEHVMRHEFYHYLEFLTHGPMSREEFTQEYHRKSEAEAEDFANAYGT